MSEILHAEHLLDRAAMLVMRTMLAIQPTARFTPESRQMLHAARQALDTIGEFLDSALARRQELTQGCVPLRHPAGAQHNQDPTQACSRCVPFVMDKFSLQQQVLERLAQDLLQAERAARSAHETATHEENVAENKYDTLGLEAAYLATGQARRADAIRQAIAHWRLFRPRPYDASKGIQLGALVCLVDSNDKQQQLFLGPDGGSMQLVSGAEFVQVISSEAPLGRALLGKCEGDEVSIQVAPIRQQFEVLRVQ